LLDEHLGVSPAATDAALYAHQLGALPAEPASTIDVPAAERRLLDRAAVAGGRSGAEAARREAALDRLRQRAAQHVSWAAGVWPLIKGFPARLQGPVVRTLQGGERSWALAVRLSEASEAA